LGLRLSVSKKALFLDFIRSVVELEPEERLCARELLGAPRLEPTWPLGFVPERHAVLGAVMEIGARV